MSRKAFQNRSPFLIAGLAAGEMLSLFHAQGNRPVGWATVIGTMIVVASNVS